MIDEFTDNEKAAIDKAAAAHLEYNFIPSDAQDLAYDIASDIRAQLTITALEEAATALDHAADIERETQSHNGLAVGAKLLRKQAAAIQAEIETE